MRDRELEVLATAAHGALAALHLLGLIFNWRRGQRFDAAMHAGWFVYDGVSTLKHWRAAR